ncbi:DNA binding domain-containing protein, excisionase family [Mycolicibacterium neoaurum]|uniref:helix-turn-helix domain-containing protein n=1 Tax=Mycolicibacterium neoaurum TaxID=1795 RepID=UPI00088630A2|nr:helix-turn-helix domain-containing protein [Mycolicibacterium neoaurum]SDD59430.1 DNA binding domain-containing protein, excisionase family [Mycolicibacterium neoaurum]
MSDWPWPDDRFERRSRVAHMYRDRLADLDAAACAELDEVMVAYGQTWIVGRPDITTDQFLTTAQVAEWADVSKRTVQKWVERGHLERRMNADNEVVFLLQDLIEYQKRRTHRSA